MSWTAIASRYLLLVNRPCGVILNQPLQIQWLQGRNGIFPTPLSAQTENTALLVSVQRRLDASGADQFSESQ